MTTTTMSIRLSRHEIDYLCNAGFLGLREINALRGVEWPNDASAVLKLSRDPVEKFRDAFTTQLAKVGFDEKYDVPPEGQILEDMIDRFYVP